MVSLAVLSWELITMWITIWLGCANSGFLLPGPESRVYGMGDSHASPSRTCPCLPEEVRTEPLFSQRMIAYLTQHMQIIHNYQLKNSLLNFKSTCSCRAKLNNCMSLIQPTAYRSDDPLPCCIQVTRPAHLCQGFNTCLYNSTCPLCIQSRRYIMVSSSGMHQWSALLTATDA